MNFQIEQMLAEDWGPVSQIYLECIETGNATFEKTVPSWEIWISNHPSQCNIVARRGDQILGWAALSPTSNRKVYSGVVEVSVYVKKEHRGKRIGIALLRELIKLSEKSGFWTLQVGIFPENDISINLHQKLGFRIVGKREKIGKIDGIWRDVVLMERRSKIVGVD